MQHALHMVSLIHAGNFAQLVLASGHISILYMHVFDNIIDLNVLDVCLDAVAACPPVHDQQCAGTRPPDSRPRYQFDR